MQRGPDSTGTPGVEPGGWPGPGVLIVAVALLTWLCSARPAAGQQLVTVQGVVVDQASRDGVPGISITLTGHVPVLTDEAGRFRFGNIVPGQYRLTVQGVGYVPTDRLLAISADTALVIELEVAPVPLDTLAVSVREVTVKGEVRELSSGIGLIDADVFATPDIEKTTDLIGRFKIDDVPSGLPFTARVQSFGYLPVTLTFVPQSDTTLTFDLEHDPIVQRMIAVQMERIDERSVAHRYEALPTLERDDLLNDLNGPIGDVLRRQLGPSMYRRIGCVIIDENEIMAKWRYQSLPPDRVHRLEVIEVPGPSRSLMVRIYTRDFVQDMVRGTAGLVDQELALRRVAGRCR